VIGILNGLLPCGLVYLSIIGAVTTGSSIDGAAYMIVFGMGTIPAMFLVGFWGSKISFEWRFKVSRFIPYMIGILAVMFILRGMNLGIPYLSPKISSEKLMTSQCCSK
jgi:sulfite exporter TauE/SafE